MWEDNIIPQMERPVFSRFYLILPIIVVILAIGRPVASQTVPVSLQAAIFFKVLSYDGRISSKSGNQVMIYIVIDKKSSGQKDDILAGFNNLSGKSLGGKRVKVLSVDASDITNIAEHADVIYAASGSDNNTIEKIVTIASERKIATLGGDEAIAEMGFAVGLAVEEGKPKIVVNFAASQEQGMKLSSKLLRLAKIIK